MFYYNTKAGIKGDRHIRDVRLELVLDIWITLLKFVPYRSLNMSFTLNRFSHYNKK